MKKTMSTILAISITLTAPSYALTLKDLNNHWAKSSVEYLIANGVVSGYSDGTFKPNKTITNSEFLSLVLKAIKVDLKAPLEGEKWDAPIMRKALEMGIIKKGEPMTNSSQNITREQTATVLYRVLQQTEKLEDYYGQYNYPLEHVVTDYAQISKEHLAGVAMLFQQGIMNGSEKQEANKPYITRLINPKGEVTRAEMSVLISKIMDKSRRLSEHKVSRKTQTKIIEVLPLKVSPYSISMPFKNDKPLVDEKKVIKELENTTYNIWTTDFGKVMKMDEYINHEWAVPTSLEEKTEKANTHYETVKNTFETNFNVSYKDDLKQYEKDLRYWMPFTGLADAHVKNHLKMIKDKKLTIESQLVTDKSLFYRSSSNEKRVKMRLYFRIKSDVGASTVPFYEYLFKTESGMVNIKTNQWYQFDLEGENALIGGEGKYSRTWHNASMDYSMVFRKSWNLSDLIPIKAKQ